MSKPGQLFSDEVAIAASFLRLRLICALLHSLKLPDWQLPSLLLGWLKVSSPIGPSNVYPRGAPAARETLQTLLPFQTVQFPLIWMEKYSLQLRSKDQGGFLK